MIPSTESDTKSYTFNEVATLTDVKSYVLRFWETEFIEINPTLSKNGERLYSSQDILVVKTIKKLLFKDKLSIPEAKSLLTNELDEIQNQDLNLSLTQESLEYEEVDIKAQSKDLKNALEQIVTHGMDSALSHEKSYAQKSSPLVQSLRENSRKMNHELSHSSIVQLINSKKKLSKLLSSIEELERKYNW